MENLTYIQYGASGSKGSNDAEMYWGPRPDQARDLQVMPKQAEIIKWLNTFKNNVGDLCVFLPEIEPSEAPMLKVPGKFLTGNFGRFVFPSRRTLWVSLSSDKKRRELVDTLLTEGSVMNESIVCSGSVIGLFLRLERIRNVRDMAVTTHFGPAFFQFVRERWPWKCKDVGHFARLKSAEELLSLIKITGASEAGPGYVREEKIDEMKVRYVNLKKGDEDARKMCSDVIDTIFSALASGMSLTEILSEYPGWFVAQMKAKTDYYKCEEVFGEDIFGRAHGNDGKKYSLKTRPYFAFQYHLTLLFSGITQFISDCQENYQTNPKSWSMIGHSWMHGGTQKLWDYLRGKGDYVPQEVFSALFYGDDAVYRFSFTLNGEKFTVVCLPDVQGMDFTLTPSATAPHGSGFAEYCEWMFSKWTVGETLDLKDFLLPPEWRQLIALWGTLAVACPFLVSGKHLVQLLCGLRAGIPGTTFFDEYQSFRIFYKVREYMERDLRKIAELCASNSISKEDVVKSVQSSFDKAGVKMRNKFGINFKLETTMCYLPETFVKNEFGFENLKVTPYTILGYRLAKMKGRIVPAKPLDEVWRSLIRPRGTYKNGQVADMVELERLRGVALSSAWVYPQTYDFIQSYFTERRKTGKINVNRSLGRPLSLPLYPLTSIPDEILKEIMDNDVKLFQAINVHMADMEDEYSNLILERELRKQVMGDPDWFPTPEFIAELYEVERETVSDLASLTLQALAPKSKKVSRTRFFEQVLTGSAWADEVLEEEEEAKEELEESLRHAGFSESDTRNLRVRVEGDRVIGSRAGETKHRVDKTVTIKRGATEVAVGKTSKNRKRLEELVKARKEAGRKYVPAPAPREEELEEKANTPKRGTARMRVVRALSTSAESSDEDVGEERKLPPRREY